jgi:hypothetical protein
MLLQWVASNLADELAEGSDPTSRPRRACSVAERHVRVEALEAHTRLRNDSSDEARCFVEAHTEAAKPASTSTWTGNALLTRRGRGGLESGTIGDGGVRPWARSRDVAAGNCEAYIRIGSRIPAVRSSIASSMFAVAMASTPMCSRCRPTANGTVAVRVGLHRDDDCTGRPARSRIRSMLCCDRAELDLGPNRSRRIDVVGHSLAAAGR